MAARSKRRRRWRTMSTHATQLYDRRAVEVMLDEVESVLI
jgi:hypothetical protein